MTVCTSCNTDKPAEAFPLSYKKSGSRRGKCQVCKTDADRTIRKANLSRFASRQREYNKANKSKIAIIGSRAAAKKRGYMPCISSERELDAAFTGSCHSCGSTKPGLHMDHCHDTGRFRGWLCNGCNLAAGYLYNSPLAATMLSEYLEKVT